MGKYDKLEQRGTLVKKHNENGKTVKQGKPDKVGKRGKHVNLGKSSKSGKLGKPGSLGKSIQGINMSR